MLILSFSWSRGGFTFGFFSLNSLEFLNSVGIPTYLISSSFLNSSFFMEKSSGDWSVFVFLLSFFVITGNFVLEMELFRVILDLNLDSMPRSGFQYFFVFGLPALMHCAGFSSLEQRWFLEWSLFRSQLLS